MEYCGFCLINTNGCRSGPPKLEFFQLFFCSKLRQRICIQFELNRLTTSRRRVFHYIITRVELNNRLVENKEKKRTTKLDLIQRSALFASWHGARQFTSGAKSTHLVASTPELLRSSFVESRRILVKSSVYRVPSVPQSLPLLALLSFNYCIIAASERPTLDLLRLGGSNSWILIVQESYENPIFVVWRQGCSFSQSLEPPYQSNIPSSDDETGKEYSDDVLTVFPRRKPLFSLPKHRPRRGFSSSRNNWKATSAHLCTQSLLNSSPVLPRPGRPSARIRLQFRDIRHSPPLTLEIFGRGFSSTPPAYQILHRKNQTWANPHSFVSSSCWSQTPWRTVRYVLPQLHFIALRGTWTWRSARVWTTELGSCCWLSSADLEIDIRLRPGEVKVKVARRFGAVLTGETMRFCYSCHVCDVWRYKEGFKKLLEICTST